MTSASTFAWPPISCGLKSAPFQQGWKGKKNGDLLRLTAAHFDVFVTTDQGVQFQQPISKLRLGVVCLVSPSDEFEALRALVPRLRHAIMKVKPGQLIRLEI